MSGPKVLYVSSSIGLGHVGRDIAIARELRRLEPGIEILWVAASPASDVLREAGENLLPEAERWRGASRIAERCVRNGRLDLVHYVYRSLPAWAANALLFREIIASHDVDIAVGDEAFEVDIPLLLRILRLPVPFVMIYDFVATDAMTTKLVDRVGAWLLNALWSLDGHLFGGTRDSAIFIGEPEDIPSKRFGWLLPNRRQHAVSHYDIVGHAVTFRPEDYSDRAAWRRRLGYGSEPLVVGAVGGTSVGRDLLELCAAAAPVLRESLPDARMVLVCGPRLSAESLHAPEGVTVLGYVPRLYEHFACCDVAVVLCGGSSTTELAALGTPFVYVPIEGHFEQELVAARLAHYGIGLRLSLHSATPELLAQAIRQEMGHVATGASMPLQGAPAAARHILKTLHANRRARWRKKEPPLWE
jgi:hypothetical protein